MSAYHDYTMREITSLPWRKTSFFERMWLFVKHHRIFKMKSQYYNTDILVCSNIRYAINQLNSESVVIVEDPAPPYFTRFLALEEEHVNALKIME